MVEVERLAYLSALGITQYVARDSILGAKQSPQLSVDQVFPPSLLPQDSALADTDIETAAVDTQPVAQLKNALATSPAVEQQPVAVDKAPEKTQGSDSTEGLRVNIPQELLVDSSSTSKTVNSAALRPKAGDNLLEFCFVLLQTPQGLAFLMELADPGVKDMSSSEHRLATDLLQALKIEREQVQANYFKWPLVNNPRLKQGPEEARESLTGYLDSKLADSAAATLLIFGDMPNRLLGREDQQLDLSSKQLMTVKLPALSAMLHNWQHKAHAWRLLAPLRGRKL